MLEVDLIASKAGPVLQVDVHGTAQPMRATAYTIRPPDPGRIEAASRDARHAGRRDSDGVIFTYREARDLSASVFCPHPKRRFSSSNHTTVQAGPPGG
jgi:hypothetical protein